MSTQTDTLFKPGHAGAIPVANRVFMAPMTRNRAGPGRCAGRDGGRVLPPSAPVRA